MKRGVGGIHIRVRVRVTRALIIFIHFTGAVGEAKNTTRDPRSETRDYYGASQETPSHLHLLHLPDCPCPCRVLWLTSPSRTSPSPLLRHAPHHWSLLHCHRSSLVHNPCTSRSHASVALCVHLAGYRHGDLVVTRCRHRRVRRDPSARDFAAGDVVKREGRDNQSRSRECTVFFVCIPIHVRRRVVQRMRLLQRTS